MISQNMSFLFLILLFLFSCKGDKPSGMPPTGSSSSLNLAKIEVNGRSNGKSYYHINGKPEIKLYFSAPVRRTSVKSSFTFENKNGAAVAYEPSYENKDSVIIIQPSSALQPISQYSVLISTAL